ncbi:hypothetical protein PR048_025523 [Dryococelus australis]|uniref:DDE Tnp4 domain-containing protein n=1 Tax=Dryococelus australis TaxID=614101 RepID=A0ABQ9GRM4_9NEOP|nr:hypothetical protein PR048_025523 [Dryococelus australis]
MDGPTYLELWCYPGDWTNYLRMDEPTHLELLSSVTPVVTKPDTCMRKAITPNEILTATLRYLATGRTLEYLKFSFRIAPQTLGKIIPDICEAIFKALRNYYKEGWENVAREFEHRWNFPNCIGAIDGKYVAITPPSGSGSYFYNYKNFHSQVLLGIANANYELLYFSFGTNGRVSDRGLFETSDLSKKLEDGSPNLRKEGTVAGKKYAVCANGC